MARPKEVRANVELALALGWHMQEAYLAQLPAQPGQPEPDRRNLRSLVSWSDLSLAERALVLTKQVVADIGRLGLLKQTEAKLVTVTEAFEKGSQPKRDDYNKALQDLHVQLITLLTADDAKAAKAYRLGFAMSETALRPIRYGQDQYPEVFQRYRLGVISGWLRDLKSCLPDHAGDATQASLEAWRAWCEDKALGKDVEWAEEQDRQRVERALRLQADNWRSVLTGEKLAVDLLTTADYVRAAGDMVGHIAELARSFLKTRAGVWLLLLLGGTIVLSVLVLVLGIGSAVVAAGLAIVGSLGITAASVGAVVQKALAPVQQALWQSDLTTAISRAITALPLQRSESLTRLVARRRSAHVTMGSE